MKGLWAILLVVLYFTLSFLASCDTRTGRELSADDVDYIDSLTDYDESFYCIENDAWDWNEYVTEMFWALEQGDAEEFLHTLDLAGEYYEELKDHIDELEGALDSVREVMDLDK